MKVPVRRGTSNSAVSPLTTGCCGCAGPGNGWLMTLRSSLAAVLVAVVGALGACGGDDEPAAGEQPPAELRLQAGSAVLELYEEAQRKFDRLGIRVTAAGEASRIGDRDAFTFPIEGGRLGRLVQEPLEEPAYYGLIQLGGGLEFSSDQGTAVLRELTITTRRNGVLATAGDVRALMFNLEQPRLRLTESGVLAGRFGMELSRRGAIAVEGLADAPVAPGGNIGQLEVRGLPDRQVPG